MPNDPTKQYLPYYQDIHSFDKYFYGSSLLLIGFRPLLFTEIDDLIHSI